MKRLPFVILILLLAACRMTAQERKVQHRPSIDQRKFHYGP